MIEWLAKIISFLLPKTKIVRKFFVGYVLIILLPITILAYFLYNQLHDRFLDEYMQSRQELIEQANNNLKIELAQVESINQLFQYNSYVLEFLGGSYGSRSEHVYNLIKYIRPVYSYLYVGNPQIVGITLFSLVPEVYVLGPEFRRIEDLIENQPKHEIILGLKPGQGIWLYGKNEDGALPLLYYYQKIFNKEYSKQIGIMEVKITNNVFVNLLDKVKTTPNDRVVVLSENGSILFSDKLETRELNAIQAEEKNLSNKKSGYVYLNQTNLRGNMVYMEPLNLRIITFTNENVDIKKEMQWLVLGGIICLLLLSTIYYWIAISLTRRILKLARHMRSIDSSNFSMYKDRTNDRDEINFLAASYNAMLQRINELVNTVHREELLRKEADYKVLQAQIRPHFLYNTLESIRMLAEVKGVPEVADFTHTFGKLIRYSLLNDKTETTLKDELDHVKDFLVIHKNRVGERLHYEIEVTTPINGFICPRFILQPLVENSIVHGLSKRRKQWWLRIQVYDADNYIAVEISDNGIGIEEERLQMISEILQGKRDLSNFQTNSSGLGVYNVHERIKSFYGPESGLILSSFYQHGTTCIIRLRKGDH